MQSATDLFLMIYTTSDYGGGSTGILATSRPTAARARKTVEGYYNGLSIGKMGGRHAGDPDSTNFVDTTWFGRGGFFHSADMHMVDEADSGRWAMKFFTR